MAAENVGVVRGKRTLSKKKHKKNTMFNDIVAKRLHQSKHVLCFVNEIEKIDATAGITEGVFRGF